MLKICTTTLITKPIIATTEASETDNILANGLGLKGWVSEVIFAVSHHHGWEHNLRMLCAIPQQIHQISHVLVVKVFCGNQEVPFGFEAKCQPNGLWPLFQLKMYLLGIIKGSVHEDWSS